MANSGFPTKPGGLQNWQRAHLVAALNYLGEILGRTPGDARARAVYEGLMEVLDPARRATRAQREMAEAARTAAYSGVERRRTERRRDERRKVGLGPPAGNERRSGRDRRTGRDRRKT